MIEDHNNNTGAKTITIIAPARLHMGFLDMHGGMGRNFGSLGLCLSEIYTRIQAKKAPETRILGAMTASAQQYVEQMLKHFDIDTGIEIQIHDTIPVHAGLGSGTQLSLAIGVAIARLCELSVSNYEIAGVLNRGQRSGIGVGSFSRGGFMVDGGRGKHTGIPPIVSHMHFPSAWRIVLILDPNGQGLSGSSERQAFNTLPVMSEDISARLCRTVLMQVLPALAEHNCTQFGGAIQAIQELVGDHFTKVQGNRYTSQAVSEALEWFTKNGASGVGQSSWGPTGFALFPHETAAFKSLLAARTRWSTKDTLRFMLCRARNRPADIIHSDAAYDMTTDPSAQYPTG